MILDEAVGAVRDGLLVVVPTDTVYGIGTRPDDPAATARLFEAKGRPRDLELPILVASLPEARRAAVFDARAERLAGEFWPGALTIVLPRAPASREWDLGGDPETVGVRMPHHPLARALLSATGPMAVTSANRSGVQPLTTCDELTGVFGDAVAVYLCQDEPLVGEASSVVDLAHGEPRPVRAGSVTDEQVRRALS